MSLQFTIFALYGLIIWFGGLEVDSGRVDFDGRLAGRGKESIQDGSTKYLCTE
jgi:hypothetical protein